MKLIIGTTNIQPMSPRPVVAIGNFDGLHLGHRAILQQAVERAAASGGTAVALTFDPHPAHLLAPERETKMLYSFQTKMRLIESTGVDATCVVDFDADFAQQSPQAFIGDFLLKRLNVAEVVVGENYRFGKNREGGIETLRAFGGHFSVTCVEPVEVDGIVVSSSRIRAALQAGDVRLTGRMLGRPFATSGKVIKGEGRGRSLGFPTANLRLPNESVPGSGIYAARIDTLRAEAVRPHDGIVYIGTASTFQKSEIRLEAHLFDFDGDLYDQRLLVHFIDRVRPDQTFSDTADLIRQMHVDVEQAKKILADF
jgi:riboflavin kinase/FMN adenylyltransferase